MPNALDNLFSPDEKAAAAKSNAATPLDFLFPEHAGEQYQDPALRKSLQSETTKILGIIPAKSGKLPTEGEQAVVEGLKNRWNELTNPKATLGERAGAGLELGLRGTMLRDLLGGQGNLTDPALGAVAGARAQTPGLPTGPWVTPSKGTGMFTPPPPGAATQKFQPPQPSVPPTGLPPGGAPPGPMTGPTPPAQPPGGVPPQPPAPAQPPQPPQPPAPTPPPPRGSPPQKFDNWLADELFKLRQGETADKLQAQGIVQQIPPEAKNPQVQEKIYHHIEDPAGNPLNPQEQQLKAQLDPLKALEYNLYERAQLLKGEPAAPFDPTYMHRIARGHAERYDKYGPAPGNQDPITGGGRTIGRNTGALEERGYFALTSPRTPGRMVVSPTDKGDMIVWNQGAPTRMPISGDVRPGQTIKIGNQTFNVGQATTKEIEQHARHTDKQTGQPVPASYVKNATVNTLENIVHLKRTVRNLEFFQKLQLHPEWQRLTTTDSKRATSLGWQESKMPAFRGTYMDPKIRAVIDDYYRPGILDKDFAERIAKVNRFLVGSLFWNPLPHIENVGGHWFVSRGIDWIRPQQYRSLFKDGWRAFNEVRQGGRLYQDLLREGSGLVSGGVANQDFYRVMAAKMGMDIEAHPERWGKIARTLGFNKPIDLVNAYYGHVRKILWQANDVFMVQRVLELEGKGMSRQEAIHEAERDIPNYRIPAQVLGSRPLAQIMQDPNVTVFSRYHYGVFKSYAEMLKGISKGNVEDMGKLFTLGVLTWGIYPVISMGLAKITGDERAEKLKRGPAAFPSNLIDMYEGDKTWGQVLGSAFTWAPGARLAVGLIAGGGRDPFTGQQIVEPDDVREGNYGRVAGQALEYGAEQVGPYQATNQIWKNYESPSSIPGGIARQMIGMKNVSDRSERGKRIGEKIDRKKAIKRQIRPHGIIEGLFSDD